MKKIWIYQADRFFTQPELETAKEKMDAFIKQWTAHGSELAGSCEFKYNLFVIITVDETLAPSTGCSVDKSVRMLKQLETDLQISLFNRMLFAYRDSEGSIQLVSRDVFDALFKEGVISGETIVFNNLIEDANDLASKWEVPLNDSWHKAVFKK